MKNLSLFTLLLTLLACANSANCSAAQAMRLLKQGAQSTCKWIENNPTKFVTVCGGIPTTLFACADFYVTRYRQSKYMDRLEQSIEQNNGNTIFINDQHKEAHNLILKMVLETTKEHGLKDVTIITSGDNNKHMACQRLGKKMLIFVHPYVSYAFSLEELQAVTLHEIGHLKENHALLKTFGLVTLESNIFKIGLAIMLGMGAGTHMATNGITKIKTVGALSPKSRAIATGGLLMTLPIISIAGISAITTKTIDTSSLVKKCNRFLERRADQYVVNYAFEKRNPKLLTDFSSYFLKDKNGMDIPLRDGKPLHMPPSPNYPTTHPTSEERYNTTKTAEQKLHALMQEEDQDKKQETAREEK